MRKSQRLSRDELFSMNPWETWGSGISRRGESTFRARPHGEHPEALRYQFQNPDEREGTVRWLDFGARTNLRGSLAISGTLLISPRFNAREQQLMERHMYLERCCHTVRGHRDQDSKTAWCSAIRRSRRVMFHKRQASAQGKELIDIIGSHDSGRG